MTLTPLVKSSCRSIEVVVLICPYQPSCYGSLYIRTSVFCQAANLLKIIEIPFNIFTHTCRVQNIANCEVEREDGLVRGFDRVLGFEYHSPILWQKKIVSILKSFERPHYV